MGLLFRTPLRCSADLLLLPGPLKLAWVGDPGCSAAVMCWGGGLQSAPSLHCYDCPSSMTTSLQSFDDTGMFQVSD